MERASHTWEQCALHQERLLSQNDVLLVQHKAICGSQVDIAMSLFIYCSKKQTTQAYHIENPSLDSYYKIDQIMDSDTPQPDTAQPTVLMTTQAAETESEKPSPSPDYEKQHDEATSDVTQHNESREEINKQIQEVTQELLAKKEMAKQKCADHDKQAPADKLEREHSQKETMPPLNKQGQSKSKQKLTRESGSDLHLTTTADAGPQIKLVFYRPAAKEEQSSEQEEQEQEEDDEQMLSSQSQDSADEEFFDDQYPQDYDDFVESIVYSKLKEVEGKQQQKKQEKKDQAPAQDYPHELIKAKRKVLEQDMQMRCYQMENMGQLPPVEMQNKKSCLVKQLLDYVNKEYLGYLNFKGGKKQTQSSPKQNGCEQSKLSAEPKKKVNFDPIINAKSFKVEDEVTVMNDKEVLVEQINQKQKPPNPNYLLRASMQRIQMLRKQQEQRQLQDRENQMMMLRKRLMQRKAEQQAEQQQDSEDVSQEYIQSDDEEVSEDSLEYESQQKKFENEQSLSSIVAKLKNRKNINGRDIVVNRNRMPQKSYSPEQVVMLRKTSPPQKNHSLHGRHLDHSFSNQVLGYPTKVQAQLPRETYYRLTFKRYHNQLYEQYEDIAQIPSMPVKESCDVACQTILTFANDWE